MEANHGDPKDPGQAQSEPGIGAKCHAGEAAASRQAQSAGGFEGIRAAGVRRNRHGRGPTVGEGRRDRAQAAEGQRQRGTEADDPGGGAPCRGAQHRPRRRGSTATPGVFLRHARPCAESCRPDPARAPLPGRQGRHGRQGPAGRSRDDRPGAASLRQLQGGTGRDAGRLRLFRVVQGQLRRIGGGRRGVGRNAVAEPVLEGAPPS